MTSERVTWPGNVQAAREAAAAYRKLRPKRKPPVKPKLSRRQRRRLRKALEIVIGEADDPLTREYYSIVGRSEG